VTSATELENCDLLPGYFARRGEMLLARWLVARNSGEQRNGLLVGPPGTGKTMFAESFAKGRGAEHVFIPCHPWLTNEELHQGVDIGRVAAGVNDADEAYLDGQLLRAVRMSHDCDVVITLDEVEKAGSRFYPLILDFLQNGRVPDARHRLHTGNRARLFAVLTANEETDLPEAIKRRCFRVNMGFLPEHIETDVLRKQTGAPAGACRILVRMANAIRQHGDSKPSLQELRGLLAARDLCIGVDDVGSLIEAFLVKEEKDVAALRKAFNKPDAVLFGEFKRRPQA
jgi:MoxR-like ATPase